MSRIGRIPIDIPSKVKVEIKDNKVIVEGPLGKLGRDIIPGLILEIQNGKLIVKKVREEDKKLNAMQGLFRSLLANMLKGVSEGFTRKLLIQGVGYRAKKKGDALSVLVGYSQPVDVEPLPGIKLDVEEQTTIVVRGIDKEKVGQMAANIRAIRPPDAYKGKGIIYENETLRRKVGKAGKAK